MAGANSNMQLTGLDFDQIKNNLKLYLKDQDVLKDVNYEGSVISTLLDILAYNTHYMGHYLNMVGNEMFLDTATRRSSVISHAKLLGYVPSSAASSVANINITFHDLQSDFITIPKSTKFVSGSTLTNKNYSFITKEEIYLTRNNSTLKATANNVELIQGEPINYTFTHSVKTNPTSTFKIPDARVDISTLKVLVQKSSRDVNLTVFTPPQDNLAVTSTSNVYWIQESLDGYYEIYFGDGILGKKLDDGNIIHLTYITVSKDDTSGISSFSLVSKLGDYSHVTIDTVTASTSGSEKESIDSIKFIAPKAYSAQDRAVTVNDYISMIQKNSQQFPIDAVNVWPGDQNNPPVYGKVFIAIKPKGGFILTQAQKNKIRNNIVKPISVLTVDPVVIDADYIFVKLKTNILYNSAKTLITNQQLSTYITNSIRKYLKGSLNSFNSTFMLPDLTETVKSVDPSIITNETSLILQKRIIPELKSSGNYTIDFGIPIKRDIYRKSVNITPSIKQLDVAEQNYLRNEIFIEETPSSASSIQTINILNSGFNYTSTPTITITGDGSGAKAHAIIKNQKISEIVIDNVGSGYTQAIVTISGGGGILGAAVAVLDSQFGTLRSYYYFNGTKIIFNANVGTVDYTNGIVYLTDFNPFAINNELQVLNINVVPETTIISSSKAKILTIDENDPEAIQVTLTPK